MLIGLYSTMSIEERSRSHRRLPFNVVICCQVFIPGLIAVDDTYDKQRGYGGEGDSVVWQ